VLAGDPKLGLKRHDLFERCGQGSELRFADSEQLRGIWIGIGAGELGFVLQNRGTLFALDPGHANTLEPHRRPFHTIIPAMVTKNGKPYFVFGVMGGDMQPQGHVEFLVNLLDFGMDVYARGGLRAWSTWARRRRRGGRALGSGR